MKCKCGSSKHKITGGGEYFKKLRKPIWVCVSKSCPHPKPNMQTYTKLPDNLLDISKPLGQLVMETEFVKRELGTSQNKCVKYEMDYDSELAWMHYVDCAILV